MVCLLEAVVFDFDGVIVDTPTYYFKHMREYFRKRSSGVTDEDIEHIIGHTFQKKLDFINAKYGLKVGCDEFLAEIGPAMNAEMDRLVKLDLELHRLLRELRACKIRAAIASNNSPETINFFLEKFGIREFFRPIVTIRDVQEPKPDPETYQKALLALGAKARDCIAIEDTVIGVESAKRAGMRCIAIPNKFTSKHNFAEAGLVVKSFRGLDVEKLQRLV